MPNITIDGPKIESIEIKRVLVKEITDSIENAYKIPRDHIVVVINEQSPENVGVAGKLISDMRRG
ncbi:MAG: tautomerase family protein [Candidatus Lokiarchaeota archaeon]|nr:tautomerase family protein [Candidatus Lokiarchaeota archaeon]